MSVTLRIIRDDGTLSSDIELVPGSVVTVDSGGRVAALPPRSEEATHARLVAIEHEVARLRDAVPAGSPYWRDMSSAALDAARARKLNAEADKLEREIAEQFGGPADDGASPVHLEGWSVTGRSDIGLVQAKVYDRGGRDYLLTCVPASARALAEQLLGGARFAETGSGST